MKPTTANNFPAMPMPQRPLNPSPLEMVIYNYEVKARAFHLERNKAAPRNESPQAKLQRIAKCERDQKHLRMERRKIAAHVRLQTQLTDYRAANKLKSSTELQAEEHHPTKSLVRNLRAVGEVKPTSFHEAHHIIPGKGRYLKVDMLTCRLNLHQYGIGINDPVNGVWLRNFVRNTPDDWATPEAPAHRKLHTYQYEEWISDLLSNDNLPEALYLNRLHAVKVQLKTGTHPVKILEEKRSS